MKTLLALVAALLVAACATITTPPSVSLAGVDLESIGIFEQRYVLQLRVKNPNNADIPVQGLSFDVELNGKPFATGVSNQSITIPRLGEALLDVRASSNLASLLKQWRDLEKGGRNGLDYRIKGNLRVAGYGAVPFDHRGEVPIPLLDSPSGERSPSKSLPGAF